jgi:4-alpha-glucanotransferase
MSRDDRSLYWDRSFPSAVAEAVGGARLPASASPPEVVARVHEALGRAPSRILTATLDDAMAVEERPNMPATNDEWPNWRLALPEPIETLKTSRLAKRIARALNR